MQLINRYWLKAALLVVVLTFAAYICIFLQKKGPFDSLFGNSYAFKISYSKGFSAYNEYIYTNKENDVFLFDRVVSNYERYLEEKNLRYEKVYHNGLMTNLKSLPFQGWSENTIKEQMDFRIVDQSVATEICNGGEFIVIRYYSLR